jgi:8-oxo-dGTP pyrophosphatase MutT (NUDIX family)
MQEKDLNSYVGTKGIVVNSSGEVLLVKESFSGNWELPGGRIQKTEMNLTREECLSRELKEELGENFQFKILKLVDTMFRKFEKPRNPQVEQVFLVVYECEYLGGEIDKQDEEVLDVAWVSKDNYQNYDYVNGYKKVLDNYFSRN